MPDLTEVTIALLWTAEALSISYVSYRMLLGWLSLRAPRPAPYGPGSSVFLILIPSHDEELIIADTIASIERLDYPAERRLIYVLADDCSDSTFTVARAAGAHVLVKATAATGKGEAIDWALKQAAVQAESWDALIVFDADSRPAVNFLQIMDGALLRGFRAIQGRRESHAQVGWVPTAYAVNTLHRNRTWHQAREAMGFNAAFTGSGYCLARDLLAEYPVATRTLTEDLEYTAKLTQAGVRIHYLHSAVVVIDQPPTLGASIAQRLRWARGQMRTAVVHGPALIWRALTRLDVSAFDTALYLLLPSLVPMQALLVLIGGATLIFGGIGPHAGLPAIPVAVLAALLAASSCLPYFGLRAERSRFAFRDWVAFLLLMLTWLPIAVFAAMTTSVSTWYRTPRNRSISGKIAGKAEQPEHVRTKD